MEAGSQEEKVVKSAAPAAFRLKRILVPVDFSECSRKALRYALPLAELHQACITLIYVVPHPFAVGEYGGIDYTAIETDLLANANKELDTLLKELGSPKTSFLKMVRTGSAAAEIVHAAKEMIADLIVISTHGHTGLKHVFLGSVAEHVVRHAPCPVLVVREHEHDFVAD